MIFSGNKITSDKVLVRFYHYRDVNMGYGDAGTAKYIEIPLSDFEESRHKKVNGSYSWHYKLKTEAGVRLMGKEWWIRYGYRKASQAQRDKEIDDAKQLLRKLQG